MSKLRILVAVDFSPCSLEAVRHASWLARQLDAELDVVHVFAYDTFVRMSELVATQGRIGELVEARRRLEELRAADVAPEVPTRVHVRLGDPTAGIVDAAIETGAALIVVGSEGRSPLLGRLLGSVPSKLARRSPLPVVMVPPPGAAARRGLSSQDVAFSCSHCGHLRGPLDGGARCSQCGMEPVEWEAAKISRDEEAVAQH